MQFLQNVNFNKMQLTKKFAITKNTNDIQFCGNQVYLFQCDVNINL